MTTSGLKDPSQPCFRTLCLSLIKWREKMARSPLKEKSTSTGWQTVVEWLSKSIGQGTDLSEFSHLFSLDPEAYLRGFSFRSGRQPTHRATQCVYVHIMTKGGSTSSCISSHHTCTVPSTFVCTCVSVRWSISCINLQQIWALIQQVF